MGVGVRLVASPDSHGTAEGIRRGFVNISDFCPYRHDCETVGNEVIRTSIPRYESVLFLFGVITVQTNGTTRTVRGRAFDAVGVPPDLRVPFLTQEDLQSGRDYALEKALDWLTKPNPEASTPD